MKNNINDELTKNKKVSKVVKKNNLNISKKKLTNKQGVSKKTPKKKLINEEENEVLKEAILSQKEKNRKRYEARKQRYSQEKKKNVNPKTEEKIDLSVTEPIIKIKTKKNSKVIKDQHIAVKKIDKEPKSKRLLQDEASKKKKKLFKLKWELESDIPIENNKESTRIRVKKYLKEALAFAVIITFINILVMLFVEDINYLKLFDIKILNILITIVLSLVISYIISFFIDCLITELWVKRKLKKEGGLNGNRWFMRRKRRENITN